jgi:phosphate transport system substrate-binding protein
MNTSVLARLTTLVILGALAVAACGGSSGTSSSVPRSSTPRPQAVATGNPTQPVTLQESGSTLVLPYLQKMVEPLQADYPNIKLAPSGGGSGKGISDAIAGTVQLGGSDAYLSDAQARQNPDLLNIPIAISAQAINYNLPGIDNLRLTGSVLADIYMGKITKWNDPAIARLNPSLHDLPAQTIVPVRRVESSGDTFIFTSLLSATSSAWRNGPGFGTTVTWPAVPGELTATGNPGMVQVCKQTPGCVAYVGVSVENTALQQGLGEALLENAAGNFVKPTQQTITAAVNARAAHIPDDLRAPLIYAPGAQSYPIVNYEYLMVESRQSDPQVALALRTFLTWAIDPGKGASGANLAAVNFVALPPTVVPKVKAAIARIGG